MKLSNELVKDLQKARLYRAIAVLLELAALYAVVWGIHIAIVEIISWF